MGVSDWTVVIAVFAVLIIFAIWTRRYMKGVADFLSANRCAGRYVLAIAEGAAATGAIAIIAGFEANYTAGFAHLWWMHLFMPVSYVATLSGWIAYRFRETRCLTLAQFFGIRYSREFRIFAGFLCFISGILFFGISPGIGAKFFMYFCGFPQTFTMMGVEVSTFVFIMLVLLTVATLLTLAGGQISVMVTDFIQGVFCLIVFLMILALILYKFDWQVITETLSNVPHGKSLLNPFDTGKIQSFNLWFYIILYFGIFYNFMGWQGQQAFNSSAKSAHEARMGRVIGALRGGSLAWLAIVVPICGYVVMHHPNFASIAESVNGKLAGFEDSKLHNQMIVPLVLTYILPKGLIGAFCAIMLCTFLATHNSSLHSWGSIFIQDVILPLRKKPLTPEQHMRLLRYSIIGVAVFVFLWSWLFKLEQYLMMYFAVTSAIFLGGAGIVIIGGLYWKRGTTAAAFSAMIVGSALAVAGTVVDTLYPNFPVHGQWAFGISSISAIITYLAVSLLGTKRCFNMNQLLHRGIYKVEDGGCEEDSTTGWKKLVGITKQFTRIDMIPYLLLLTLGFGNSIMASCVSIYYWIKPFGNEGWSKVWQALVYFNVGLAAVVTVWVLIGGSRDVKNLFVMLDKTKRDVLDDGRAT